MRGMNRLTEPFQNELPKVEYINNSIEGLVRDGNRSRGETAHFGICVVMQSGWDARF